MSRKFSEQHEWVEARGEGVYRVGITDYAQEQLGDIVTIEPPELGRQIEKGEECAVIESVKAASEVFAPLSGEVVATNDALDEDPALMNNDAEGEGWLMEVRASDAESDLADLMDEAAYREFVKDA
jgi:glycine cleavage system H protein